ncbi:MAG: Ig-like domain-containing protein [Xanthomonadaceae bacterium]|nr:Ig-like domain-containing protein [Xanthomonadaceae bacterium]
MTRACAGDLRTFVSPPDTTIQVGQQFPIRFTLLGCGGSQVLTDSVTFASLNPAIATVDVSSGIVDGVASGSTTIVVTAHHYRVTVNVAVTVK